MPRTIARRDALKFALATPLIFTGRAFAQQVWPTRPVSIVLPFGTGGGADIMARVVFAKTAEIARQPFVIENKPGGASVAAASYVLGTPRDGHTFFLNSTQQIITPQLAKDLPFDYSKAFVPVSQIAAYPQAVAVRLDFPAQTPEEFIAYAKANPGKVKYGTPPRGGMGHLAGIQIELRAGIRMNHIPYRLAPDATRDLAAGTIDVAIASTSTLMPMLEARKIRFLAMTSTDRSPLMPDVPTLHEKAIPGYYSSDWSGLFAATGTPEPLIQKMQEVLAQACRDPATIAKLQPQGTEIVGSPTAEFARFFEEQRVTLSKLIKEANITE